MRTVYNNDIFTRTSIPTCMHLRLEKYSTENTYYPYPHPANYGVENVGHLLAPLYFNNIKLNSYMCGDQASISSTIEAWINTNQNEVRDKNMDVIDTLTMLTQELEQHPDAVDKDEWKTLEKHPIQTLLNKIAAVIGHNYQDSLGDKVPQINMYQHKSQRRVLVITNVADPDVHRYTMILVGLVPILYPEFRERFNDSELELLKTIVDATQTKRFLQNKYYEAWELIDVDKYRALILKQEQEQIINAMATQRVESLRTEIENINLSMRETLNTYDQYLARRQDVTSQYDRAKDNDTLVTEIKDVFNMEGVYDYQVLSIGHNHLRLKVEVHTYLDIYEEEEAEIIINNLNEDNVDLGVKQLLIDVYINEKYKLKVNGAFMYHVGSFDINNVGQLVSSEMQEESGNYYICNPHIYQYHCIGNYEKEIIRTQREGNLTMYAATAITSIRNINFTDSTVLDWFLKYLADNTNRNGKTLVDKEGNELSFKEYYASLDKKIEEDN